MKKRAMIGLFLMVLIFGGCRLRDRRLVQPAEPTASTALVYPTNTLAPTYTAIPTNPPQDPTAVLPAETAEPAPEITQTTSPTSAIITPSDDSIRWPTDGWLTAAPEGVGMDSATLAGFFEGIQNENLNIDSILIVKDGYIVAEEYYNDYTAQKLHVQYSVTKSFVSALVGIALEEGTLTGLDQTVVSFFPDLTLQNNSPAKQSMTLEDVLYMRTGLDWNEGYPAYTQLAIAEDSVQYMLDLPLSGEVGVEFNYCSGCTHLLSAVLEETTGMSTFGYAQEKLFDPIGIETTDWITLNDGRTVGGWGLYLTPRDMARFGYLYLHNGEWNGQQVVPTDWVAASTAPGRSIGLVTDYGYQWWIMPFDNLFAAQGLYGQKIYVIPDHNMVVVITADMPHEGALYTLLLQNIIGAVQ